MSQGARRVYLDHAATSWPKPGAVLEAYDTACREQGVAVGRGAYRRAEELGREVERVERLVLREVGASERDVLAWTSNGTMAIHGALHSLLWQSDLSQVHVVTTVTEHNSVLRSLEDLRQRRGLQVSYIDCDLDGKVDPLGLREAIRVDTRLVVVNHASNVTGVVQDIAAMSDEIQRSHGQRSGGHAGRCVFMIDAAQSLGYVDIDMQGMGVDLLVAPGHKGLCGPLGVGMIVAKEGILGRLRSPWIGGTGRASEEIGGPFGWKESIESGNINGPAILAMGKGVEVVGGRRKSDIDRFSGWIDRLLEVVSGYASLRAVGFSRDKSSRRAERIPVLSMTSSMMSSHEMAMLLDSAFGIECRSGLHCAGAIHRSIGSDTNEGTLRLSFGHTSEISDVEAAEIGIRALGASV